MKKISKEKLTKGVKLREILEREQSQYKAFTSVFGDPTPKNYDKFLKAYADEVWVYACVYTIANAIAGLPLRFYRDLVQKGEVVKEPVTTGPIIDLFNRPSKDPNQTRYNLMEFTVASLELTGNGYWLHDTDKETGKPSDPPQELIPLIASRISIVPGTERFIDEYIYNVGMSVDKKHFKPEEITHFRYMNPNSNVYGLGSFAPGRFPIETYKNMVETNLNIFRNGAKVDGFVTYDKKLDDPSFKRLLEQFNKRHQGKSKAHKIGLLEMGMDFKELTQNLKDLEFSLGVRLTREDICAVFGVPPILVGDLSKATYANYKESIKIFYKMTIIPKLRRISPIITNTVVRKFDEYVYCEFDLSKVEALKEDEKEKAEIAKTYFGLGVSMKQIIEHLGLPFTEFPGWDKSWLPINLVEVGSEPANEPESGEEDETPKSDKKFTAKWKREKWEKFVKTAEKIEKTYHKIIEKFFSGLERDMIARIGKSKDYTMIIENKYIDDIEKVAIEIERVLFDEAGVVKKWVVESKKIHSVALDESAKRELVSIGSDIAFDINNPRVQSFLKKNALKKATETIGNNRKVIKKSLLEGVKNKESIQQLKKRISDVYEPYKKARYKAERIARTEVIGASNQGALESYEQSGVVEGKWWFAEPDARESHLIAADRYSEDSPIGIDEDFIVGAGAGPAPGQIGVAEEDINCRCTVVPSLKKR